MDRAHTCVPGPQGGRRGAPGSQASFLPSPSLAQAGWGRGQHAKPHPPGQRSLCHPLASRGPTEGVSSRTTPGQRVGDPRPSRLPRAKLADPRLGSATWWTHWRLQSQASLGSPPGFFLAIGIPASRILLYNGCSSAGPTQALQKNKPPKTDLLFHEPLPKAPHGLQGPGRGQWPFLPSLTGGHPDQAPAGKGARNPWPERDKSSLRIRECD